MAKSTRPDSHLVSLNAPSSFAAEQYQGLRLTLERLARSRDAKVFAVTSPAAGDGKTVTAINLAGALARGSDARVLLIDADLRRPTVATRLGIEYQHGLADALTGGALAIDSLITSVDGLPNLSVLPAGSPRTGVHQILRSPRLESFMA